MTSFRKTLCLLGENRNSAQDSLYRSQHQKKNLEHDVDDLCRDIHRFERRLNRKYREHVRESSEAKKRMKDIGDFKIYPRGVKHGHFPLYTPEGEKFTLEKPAEGMTYEKYMKAGNDRHMLCYALMKPEDPPV